MADVYFAYGKALLENAIAQNSVLGKEQEGAPAAEGNNGPQNKRGFNPFFLTDDVLQEPAPNGNKILSFSGDAEDEGEGDGGNDDPAVDLFAEASKLDAEGENEGEGEGEGEGEEGAGEDEAEPEDDFNAAWEVLDLARAIYEKQMDGDDEMRLKAADTFIMLGDVSLETGASYLLQLHTSRTLKLSMSLLTTARKV